MTTDTTPRRLTRTSTGIWSSNWGRFAALALAVGVGAGGVATTRFASAAGAAAVTPKTETPNEAKVLSHAFSSVAKALAPSVVRIEVEVGAPATAERMHGRGVPNPGQGGDDDDNVPPFFRRFFEFGPGEGGGMPSPGPSHGVGSGFILDTSGNIVTNRHVIQGATKVTVTLNDGNEYPAKVIGKDAQTDVAVVRLEKPPANLTAARLGDSEKLEVGEWVVAVGSPLGLEQTVTAGIVSGKGRPGRHVQMSGKRVRGYIQTDAKINPGNSGGPLVNLEGEVVGINTLINVGPGGSYGFAIPINQAWQVAGVLIKDGHVRYPYIGVAVSTLGDVPKALRDRVGTNLPPEGAFVSSVAPSGPADGAGLEAGDVITKIAGRVVKTGSDVVAAISEQRIGGSVGVSFARDGRIHAVDVKVRDFPAERTPAADAGPARLGLALQTLTEPLASSLGIAPDTKGAVVTEAAPGSPAEKAALAPGDVILEIDKQPVTSADDAVALIRAGKGPRLVRITNAAGARYVTVAPD